MTFLIQRRLKPYQARHIASKGARFSFTRGNDPRRGGYGNQPLSDCCGREIKEYSLPDALARGEELAAKFDIVGVYMHDPRNNTAVLVASQELTYCRCEECGACRKDVGLSARELDIADPICCETVI
jgi:hypothetical protein